jgi:hypothetical protein
MIVTDLISWLEDCDPSAEVETLITGARVIDGRIVLPSRGEVYSLTTGNRDGQEIVILNARGRQP